MLGQIANIYLNSFFDFLRCILCKHSRYVTNEFVIMNQNILIFAVTILKYNSKIQTKIVIFRNFGDKILEICAIDRH